MCDMGIRGIRLWGRDWCWGSFCSLRAMEFCFWTCFTTVFSYDSTLIVGLIVQRLVGSAPITVGHSLSASMAPVYIEVYDGGEISLKHDCKQNRVSPPISFLGRPVPDTGHWQ